VELEATETGRRDDVPTLKARDRRIEKRNIPQKLVESVLYAPGQKVPEADDNDVLPVACENQ
jgi:hypothetical protein